MTKLLEVTISGSFKASDDEIESYDAVVGLIPLLDEDKAQQMVIKRYAKMWIGQSRKKVAGELTDEAKYKRVSRIREVFIDSIDEVEVDAPLSYIGKDILTLDYEEIQDLAAAKDLAGVPLYKVGSLAVQRRIAYAEYAGQILGVTELDPRTKKEVPLNWRREGYNPAKLPPITPTAEIERNQTHVATLEETIDTAQLIVNKQMAPSHSGAMTLDQLKSIAEHKKIPFNANIGYAALYKKIYGEAAA